MKKFLSFLLILAMTITMQAAVFAQPAQEIEQALRWSLGSEPNTLDPGKASSTDSGSVINNMFEGLMREVNGNLEPAMAESYTVSDDQLTYTFKIRENALWSDGSPVTAYDFEYAWNKVLDDYDAENSWIFDEVNIDSFRALSSDLFEVSLTKPTPYFVGMTAFYTFFPVKENIYNPNTAYDWSMYPSTSICNGPFKMVAVIPGTVIVLHKNENYWNADNTNLDVLECYTLADEYLNTFLFNIDQYHVVTDIPIDQIMAYKNNSEHLNILPMDGLYYYSLNPHTKPLDDIRVRRALTLAIDREYLVENVTQGGQTPAVSMVSLIPKDAEGNVFADKESYGIPVDGSGIAEAKALLAAAGYPNGEGFPNLVLKYNTSTGHEAIASTVQQMWKENLNIDISLVSEEWEVFQESRKAQNFDIARSGWIGDYSDPMTFLGMFSSFSPMNYSKWVSPEYDSLIEASSTQAGKTRYNMLYQALRLLMNDSMYIPIYNYTNPVLVSDHIENWEVNSRSLWYFGNAIITKAFEERVLRAPETIEVLNFDGKSFDLRWENTKADYYYVLISVDNGEWHEVINPDGVDSFIWRPNACVEFNELPEGKRITIAVQSVLDDEYSEPILRTISMY